MSHSRRRYVKELAWNCSSCGHENLGRFTDCQNCRSPKEADETYKKVKSGAAEVTDAELLRLARAGANRTCPYCGADVRELNEVCANCAATREEHRVESGGFDEAEVGLMVQPESDIEHREGRVETSRRDGGGNNGNGGNDDSEPPRRRFNLPSLRSALMVLGGLAAVGGIVWLCVFLFVPHEVDVTVSCVSWQIDAALRQKTLRHDEGWQSNMPSDTFNESCESRQNGTEDCNPHDCNCRDVSYDCNPHDCNCHEVCDNSGNGFASCSEECDTCYDSCSREECDTCYDQCPVLENWCAYDYYDWPIVSRANTSGADLNVYPPPLMANGPNQRLETHERYQVNFSDGEDSWTLQPGTRNDFSRYPPTARWRIKVNRAGQVWPLHPLQ